MSPVETGKDDTSLKILIAEDEAISRRLLQRYLEVWGHEVVVATDGAEAWEMFQSNDFPIVISDWMMPELDGLELIRRIRERADARYVYAILLTAKSQKEDLVAGMDAGADDFVTKPFDRDELRVRLREGERIIGLERNLAQQNEKLQETNRALQETQAALVQSEKLASLGQLAAGVAHEINNPIAYVANNLAVLRRDVQAAMDVLDRYRSGRDSLNPDLVAEVTQREEDIDLPYIQENLGRQFEASLEGLRRVRDIVRNLRDFARLDEAEFNDVDLNAALESTVEITRHELKLKGIQLHTELGTLPLVPCHPSKINQVFLNILMNAVQATDSGGVITLRTRAEENDVLVEIEDNGSGIPPENLSRIFDPFFTTKPVGQGTGLGLSVSYGIIRDHGGSIEAESEVGRGTRFRIRLPRQPPPGQ